LPLVRARRSNSLSISVGSEMGENKSPKRGRWVENWLGFFFTDCFCQRADLSAEYPQVNFSFNGVQGKYPT